MDGSRVKAANNSKQKQRESRQRIAAAGENLEVSPGIEIMLNRQERDLRSSTALAKLSTIRVLFPSHSAQQLPIGGTKRDQITTAAMIGTEHKFS